MTIGFITPEYPHIVLKRSAGLGSSIKNLSKGLVSKGVKVYVFAVFQDENTTFNEEGITIISIARKGYGFLGWYLERKHIERQIKLAIKSNNIDILEAPDWTGITAFMNFKIPVVIRLHGSDAYFCNLENRKQKRKHFLFESNALKRADHIVSVSNFAAQLTKEIFKLKQDVTTIYNGVDVSEFIPNNDLTVRGRLLYFGTIIRKKGVLELAQIFNHLIEQRPEASLILIGKDAKDVFENTSTLSLFKSLLSTEAKPKVEHIQEVAYSEIHNYIASAEVVLLPSFAEAFPMTWLEALAMEKPLISSNIGWAHELMVHDHTGYTINPKDHVEYANRIQELLEDKEKAKMFGLNGRKHVAKNFSTEIVLKKILIFIIKLLKHNN